MKLTVVDQQENSLILHVEGATAAYLNTLRRIMMTEVPVMAIEIVEFGKNNSILYDEMIAHRLGLLPITTDLQGYNMKDERGSAGNPTNEAQLVLRVAKVREDTIVTAAQFESSDPKIKPVLPNMPLVKLIEGQDLELVAKAELGTGKEHMKWSPCLAYYRHYPHITITKQPKHAKAIAERYPNVFEVKGDKLHVAQNGGAYLADVDLDFDDGEATVEFKDDFVFIVESWGQLPAATIVEHAVRLYDEQLEAFAKAL